MSALLFVVCGCQKKPEAPAIDTAEKKLAPKKLAPPGKKGDGAIAGSVVFIGKPPETPVLPRSNDPVCARARSLKESESIVVNRNGTLKDVLIRVTEGVTGSYPPPEQPVSIDQRECMYQPRVSTAVAGQRVQIRNGDETLHNVHAFRGPSTLFNKVQMNPRSPVIEFPAPSSPEGPSPAPSGGLGEPGTLLKLRCDVHPWMVGYLYVADHPFVAVTGEDGSFTLLGLVDGTYRVEAWHEVLGIQSAKVTVSGKGPARLTFSYAAP